MELDAFAKWEIDRQPDDMLLHNIRCYENVLGNPQSFPKANVERLEAMWVYAVSVATGRALPGVMQP